MKFSRLSTFAIATVFACGVAQADPVVVDVQGVIYSSYDQTGSVSGRAGYNSLIQRVVNVQYTFDTDNMPTVGNCSSGGDASNTNVRTCSNTDWISASVEISNSTTTIDESLVDSTPPNGSDYDRTIAYDGDDYDYYYIESRNNSGSPDFEYLQSYSYVREYVASLLNGGSPAQTFDWTLSADGYGYGYFRYYNYDQSSGTYDPNVWASYYVTSMSVSGIDVPEPATIALLGLGLAGIGAARRRRHVA